MGLGTLDKAGWRSCQNIQRNFVKYQSHEPSVGRYFSERPSISKAVLSVIIPTEDADRGGYFAKLLADITAQDFINYELIVIKGDPRQGRAINIGAALAKGKYLLTLDDDSALPDSQTFTKLVALMDANPDIGMAGGANTIPTDASPFVKRVMAQVPRRSWEPVTGITDSDLAEHPLLIMRADAFREVGGENELIPRGLDPYLRQQFRQAGWRVVIAPDVAYHHLPPDTFGKLARQFYRNGYQAAYVNRQHPEWVIETPSDHGAFEVRRPLWLRLLRFPVRMCAALIRGRWVWFVCQCCYALGFVAFVARREKQRNT